VVSDSPSVRVPAFGFVSVLAAAALFGTLGPLSRFAYEAGLQPSSFVAWRALIGFIGIAVFVAWRVRRGARALVRFADVPARARVSLLAAAICGFSLNMAMFIAFGRITIALALLAFYTYPAMVAVGNLVLGRERLDASRVAALALALAGMIAVVASQLDPSTGIRLDAIGVGLSLGAAVCQTVFVLISRDGYRQVPTEQAIGVVLLATIIGATVVTLAAGGGANLTSPLGEPSVLPLLLFSGIFAAAIPSVAFLTGIRSIGGTRAGILMLFEPVVGVILAAWLLAEHLAPIQIAGAIAILGAAVILQRDASPGGTAETSAAGIVVAGGP